MTPVGRLRESISSLRSESAWSPMPEHLLFLKLGDDKAPSTVVTEGGAWTCRKCGMKFKSEVMLTYHQIGFCIGNTYTEDDSPSRTPFKLQEEAAIMKTAEKSAVKENSSEWCRCSDGAVPPSAVKVGFDEPDQTHTYVCLAKVGKEIIPGTVYPSQKHATVTLAGEEFKVTEYDVLVDLDNTLSWKRCEVVGGIPRGAKKGGYDSKNLQYYIARAKAPDGTPCCGQYVPQKQLCYFAWDGIECSAKDFEFLCKKPSSNDDVHKSKTKIITDQTMPSTRKDYDDKVKVSPELTQTNTAVMSPFGTKSYTLVSANPTMAVTPDTKRSGISDLNNLATKGFIRTKTKDLDDSKLQVVPKSEMQQMSHSRTMELDKVRSNEIVKTESDDAAKSKTQHIEKSKTQELDKSKTQDIGKPKTPGQSTTSDTDKSKTQELIKSNTKELKTKTTTEQNKSKTKEISSINTKELQRAGTQSIKSASGKALSNLNKTGTVKSAASKGRTVGTPASQKSGTKTASASLETSGTNRVTSGLKKINTGISVKSKNHQF